jgi:5-methylcytosine-specific restriction protein A
MKTKEAAAFLSFSSTTLNNWRCEGRGPTYFKIGGSVRYRRIDLEAWANAGEASRSELESGADCHQERQSRVKRLRGRSGATQRARRLAANPLCRDCLNFEIIERQAVEIHHIRPLARGGLDDDDNVWSLCKSCHDLRTKQELRDEAEGR